MTPAYTVGVPAWTARRSTWFLVALHVPFVVAGPLVIIPRHHLGLAAAELIVFVSMAIGLLQLRHSLAAARGVRTTSGPWTFLAICLLVYLPLPVFTWDWSFMQWFVVASAAMTLPGRLAAAGVAGPILGQTLLGGWHTLPEPGAGPGTVTIVMLYQFALLTMGGIALIGAGWLARTLADLDRAQHEQTLLVTARERLRVSRDLHDLLGHSLAAASLKGDLALSLLSADPAAARAELEDLAATARNALEDVRAVTLDEHAITLRSEIANAVEVLGAAGIHTAVDVADPELTPQAEEALAWAVREAATNTLRHSRATSWSVTVRCSAGRIRLVIINDGAPRPEPPAHRGGLAGVAARARALSGRATAYRTGDARFRLEVEIPQEQP